jgi:hypothetical protein
MDLDGETYCASQLSRWAGSAVESEAVARKLLSVVSVEGVEANAFLRKVRAIAEARLVRRTIVTTEGREQFCCNGCRQDIPDGAPRWERKSDGCMFCEGCHRDASEGAAEEGDSVVRVKVRVRRITITRRPDVALPAKTAEEV